MLKNYFKIALRNLWKKKIYSGINLLGLSVSAAFCLLVYMYIQQESSFDRFHKNSNRLYRLEGTTLSNSNKDTSKSFFSFLNSSNNTASNRLVHPYVLADDIKNSFPEVEAVVRSQKAYNTIVRINNQLHKIGEARTAYVESNFFTVFDFPLLKGNAATALSSRNSIVINERTASRFFGHDDPIGKTIVLPSENNAVFIVSAVAKDFPANSSIDYDMVLPLEAHPSHLENVADRSNNHFNYQTLLLLKKNTQATAFRDKLQDFAKNYFAATVKDWQENSPDKTPVSFRLYIRPFADAHYNVSAGWGHYTNSKTLYQLATLAIIILLIACMNYVLLTLTSTVSRSQEVGIRKTVGAARKHIVWQFLTETQILVILSIFAGLFICMTSIPLFNSLTGANITPLLFSPGDYLMGGVALFIILGITAGAYPAFVMSGMKPLNMLRKFSSIKINPALSKGLVVVQYTACILLIIASLVISGQMKYMNTMQLGFDKEQVLLIENPYDWQSPERAALTRRLYRYASSDPAIANATFCSTKFGWGFNLNGHLINNKREMIYQIPVDYSYFDFMNIQLLKGRFFSKDLPTDSSRLTIPDNLRQEGSSSVRQAIVVNETLYNILGAPPLNEINRFMGAVIIGVCKDYQFFNATQKISPAYHMIGGKHGFQYAYLKIRAGQNIPHAIDRIKTNWDRITGKQPFSFSFLDEEVKKSYESYTRWLQTINAATILAVIIACMGLFGLSALYAANRTKEVGIRKVMGASVTSIFILLNKDTIRLTLISLAIAIPPSIYFMNSWLENFAYRISLSWLFFVIAGSAGLFLAIISVSYHAIKTAIVNPVKSLRTE